MGDLAVKFAESFSEKDYLSSNKSLNVRRPRKISGSNSRSNSHNKGSKNGNHARNRRNTTAT